MGTAWIISEKYAPWHARHPQRVEDFLQIIEVVHRFGIHRDDDRTAAMPAAPSA